MFNLNHTCSNLSLLLRVLHSWDIKLIPFPLSATFSACDALNFSSAQTTNYFPPLSWYPDHWSFQSLPTGFSLVAIYYFLNNQEKAGKVEQDLLQREFVSQENVVGRSYC